MARDLVEKDYIEKVSRKLEDANYIEEIHKKGINVARIGDENYPKRLLPFEHKPKFLFYKGRLPKEEYPTAAIVGARACSNYGKQMAKAIGEELSRKGIQVISGMARGVDTYSQLGAIDGGSDTFAVLGSGVDCCYPTENIELYYSIQRQGGIISEYIPGDKPLAWHFPMRNRIISGLADKIIVIEAKENSGSLITVEWALEQGKDIWALPGAIDQTLSKGCNRLIKSGAGIICEIKNLAEEIFPDFKYVVFRDNDEKGYDKKPLEKEISLLYSELGLQPKSVYELMRGTGLDYGVTINGMLKLQLMGLAHQPFNNYYARCK